MDDPADAAHQQPAPAAQAGPWECEYAPTYDENWHNDILCSDGVNQDRPSLLPSDAYITETEIRAAGQQYEDQLNGAGVAAPESSVDEGAPVTVHDWGAAQSYASVTALRDAAVAAGYACPSWDQHDLVQQAAGSGQCTVFDTFAVYTDLQALQTIADNFMAFPAEALYHGILIGPNWYISTGKSSIALLGHEIGGTAIESDPYG